MMEDWPVLLGGVLIAGSLLILARSVLHRGCSAAEKVSAEATRQAQANAASQDTLYRQLDLVKEEMAKQVEQIEAHLSALYDRVEQRQASHRMAEDKEVAALRAELRVMLDDSKRQAEENQTKIIALEAEIGRKLASLSAAPAAVEATRIRPNEGAHVGQALAHIYWEVEALAESLRHRLASLGNNEDWEVSQTEADTIRHLPPLPVDAMRQQIGTLGVEPASLLDEIANGLTRFRTSQGAVTSGVLRTDLRQLLDQVSALLAKLERMTETVGA